MLDRRREGSTAAAAAIAAATAAATPRRPVFSPGGQALVNFLSRHSRHWPRGPNQDTGKAVRDPP